MPERPPAVLRDDGRPEELQGADILLISQLFIKRTVTTNVTVPSDTVWVTHDVILSGEDTQVIIEAGGEMLII